LIGNYLVFMLSSKVKDLKERRVFCKSEKLRIIEKFLFFNVLNNKCSGSRSKYLCNFLLNFKKGPSRVKILRRCILSNRSRGVLRPFGISRIHLREMMQFGLVPGYSKAVW
jgi:ribosomal protein S14